MYIKNVKIGHDNNRRKINCLSSFLILLTVNDLSKIPKIDTKPIKWIKELNVEALIDKANAFKNSPIPAKAYSNVKLFLGNSPYKNICFATVEW